MTLVAALAAMAVPCVVALPALAQLSVPPPPIKTYDGDPGRLGDPASWRTPEFLRDNGMVSIGAEFAYAAGYAGGGMNIGIVDSGFFAGHMREHGSLATNYAIGDRFFSVAAQGGATGPTPGFYNQAFNDSHGTHVSGTVAASRDGVGETQPDGPDRQHARRRVQQPTCTSATRTRPTACSTGSCRRPRPPRRRRTTPTSPTSIGR